MDIRGILMLLNCIVLGAITLFFFYKADKHDVVDEDYDENKRNRQGAIGWFIASIFVGALALPVMVLREVYQWKRYKLPGIEWDDICRYGFTIIVGSMLHLILLAMTSCTTQKPVVLERVINKTDTLYKTNYIADTFRVHDSIYVESYMISDTIYKTKNVYKWRDRVSVKTDTIYKAMLQTDTTRLPIPMERKLSTWERTQMHVGQFTIGAVVLVVLSLLLWLIHRKE
ncbi:hypothetical protein [Leyella stercorea]|uniref:hypothetical protein n=1 Tax=Leyella stercorea TaxID=363265 RepID=UPI001F4767B4|nr:hypothetical protein [Leyella stercorea]MCF2614736.1 hypothetical protein [Leyella stercorea]